MAEWFVVNEDPSAEISTGSSIISLAHGVQEVALTQRCALYLTPYNSAVITHTLL
jgi:hypothetical protein